MEGQIKLRYPLVTRIAATEVCPDCRDRIPLVGAQVPYMHKVGEDLRVCKANDLYQARGHRP